MACETYLKQNQSAEQRSADVRKAVSRFSEGLAAGRIKVKIGPQGAIAFEGISAADRDGVTDACVYRKLLVNGSALARAAITRAERLAGRAVDRQALAHGEHSHDGGQTWEKH